MDRNSTSLNCIFKIAKLRFSEHYSFSLSLLSSSFKSKLRFECRIDCILFDNLSQLVALVAKVIRPRKICMPMDCLARVHTLASACVARVDEINQTRAYDGCNEQLTCQARCFVTANKSRKAVQNSAGSFLLFDTRPI